MQVIKYLVYSGTKERIRRMDNLKFEELHEGIRLLLYNYEFKMIKPLRGVVI